MNDVPGGAPRPEEGGLSTEAMVARHTAQLGQLEAGLTELRSSVLEVLGPISVSVEHRVDELGHQVDDLAEQLAEVLQTLDEERRSGPVNWPALTADQAHDEWLRLAAWVDEIFVSWYSITRNDLPDCWPKHRPALVELSWLHIAHVQAYQAKAPATAAAEWHCRWQPAAMSNIKKTIPAGPQRCPDHPPLRAPHPVPPAPGHQPLAQQLAHRQHWQSSLDDAMAADLEWRRTRDQHGAPTAAGPS